VRGSIAAVRGSIAAVRGSIAAVRGRGCVEWRKVLHQ
jgi:hypothetical protein